MKKAAVPLFIQRVAKRAPTFLDLAQLAITELEARGEKVEMVCGPITTGGLGNPVVNILVFNYAIELLQDAGRPIFSQMPYEAGLSDLEETWQRDNPNERYCRPILDEFYARFLTPHFFKRAWFLPRWETSFGAQWEHRHFSDARIDIRYLPDDWMYGLKLPEDLDE